MKNKKNDFTYNELLENTNSGIIDNIYALDLRYILKYKKIDAKFAAYYILNKDFQLTYEEKKITINDVLKYQPHIKEKELLEFYLFDSAGSKKGLFDFEKFSLLDVENTNIKK